MKLGAFRSTIRLIVPLLCGLLIAAAPATSEPASINIESFGAVGDGKTLSTLPIQKAIDACAQRGGGIVQIPAGDFVTGTVILKDNVVLHLDAKAVLLGTTELQNYQLVDPFTDGTGQTRGYVLIAAVDAKHVGIEGEGAIDGNGRSVLARGKELSVDRKPFLARFVRCEDVKLSGVKLRNSAAWTLHISQCDGVNISGLMIDGHVASNNDGIDIDSSRHVSVKDCTIDTGDDAICLKTTSPRPCQDVDIAGCTLTSNCGAVKLGTESRGDFEHIRVHDCHILNARLGGIKLLSVDGANLHDVIISDTTMDAGHVAIFIRLGARLKTFRPEDARADVGALQNVVIRNFKATVNDPGILISGIPGHAAADITLQYIELNLAGKGTEQEAAAVLEEKIAAYPEITMFGKLIPAQAVLSRHVRGMKIDNLKVTTAAPDARPGILLEDAESVELTDCKLPAGSTILRR
jgi:polygalacturonase